MGMGPNNLVGNVALTFNPHVGGCRNGEDKEKEDEDEGLQVVGGNSFDPKEDCAQQLALEGQSQRPFLGGGVGGGLPSPEGIRSRSTHS